MHEFARRREAEAGPGGCQAASLQTRATARGPTANAQTPHRGAEAALLAPPKHESSFYVGKYGAHVDHKMFGGEERCGSMRLTWYRSPNDRSRCFDWELPLRSADEVESCVVMSKAGVELSSAIVDRPRAPVLLVYFGRSFEDEWLEVDRDDPTAR